MIKYIVYESKSISEAVAEKINKAEGVQLKADGVFLEPDGDEKNLQCKPSYY
ncbi:hypothetical protein JCM15548_14306 [Geofilum rubicundum JCM 15548]|uniref:Uncharacterized protein n=1 Tax=Geofilum rubicundum JCM 15548 TaxID=1236989 RepID=A0A0E9M2Y1_9BACT|nr:hypothetical protein JCM15548_14306 [Geofilum rubicundum JCM 15548]